MSSSKRQANEKGVVRADQSRPDEREEKRCVYVTVHNKQKHMQEIRATELTCNKTMCSYIQQQCECVGGTTLYFVALVSYVCFSFSHEQRHAHIFPRHNHLVVTGPQCYQIQISKYPQFSRQKSASIRILQCGCQMKALENVNVTTMIATVQSCLFINNSRI